MMDVNPILRREVTPEQQWKIQVRHYPGGAFEGPGATAPQKGPELSDFVEPLQGEHHIIESILGAFEGYCIALRRDMKEADPKDLQQFVTLFIEYIDQKHYKKEEGIMLPALTGRLSATGIQELINEHKKVRETTFKLQQLCTSWDRRQVFKIGLEFITFIRVHMEKEDRGLFPAVCSSVPAASIPAIVEKFQAEDARWKTRTKELEDMAFLLVRKYMQYVP
jgi:hemerythrin-like domain-containing protein